MGRLRTVAVVGLVSALGCGDREAAVVVDAVNVGRNAQNQITIEIVVTAAEQAGNEIGNYCTSFHIFPGDSSVIDAAPSYYGDFETKKQCDSGLRDGDQKTFFFTTDRTDIPSGLNLRAQTIVGHELEKKDVNTP
jgi:hypothetical protein